MKVYYLKTYEYSIFQYLFSYLNIDGIEIDENFSDIENNEDNYLLMSSTALSAGLGKIVQALQEIEKIFDRPKFKIVVGGPIFSIVNAEELMEAFPSISYVCIGPGEKFLDGVLSGILDPGIYNGYVVGEVRNYMISDHHLEGVHPDHHIRISFDGNTCRWGRCLFCHHIAEKTVGDTPENIFKMIDDYSRKGRHKFHFYDNYVDLKKLKYLLEMISEKDYKEEIELMFFGAKASDDFSTLDEVISKFSANPIKKVSLGVEFYHQELLNMYRKGITIEQIDRTMSWLIENNVNVGAYILLGVPGSKKEHRDRYRDFINKYGNYDVEFRPSFFRLSPGVRMFDMLDKFKIKLSGEAYNITELSGLSDFCNRPLVDVPKIGLEYLKFSHWDEEENKWISRYEDLQRHKEFMVDDPVLKEKTKFVYMSR